MVELPGESHLDIIRNHMQKCDACFLISPKNTLLPGESPALIGFMGALDVAAESLDGKRCPLIWIVDEGGKVLHNGDDRQKFLNIHNLRARFSAICMMKYHDHDTLWPMLSTHGMVFLTSDKSLTFEDVPHEWEDSIALRALYGRNLERINEASYVAFLKEDRFLVYASAVFLGKKGPEIRSLLLPPLRANHSQKFAGIASLAGKGNEANNALSIQDFMGMF
jgi:hypothetical protein